MKNTLYHKRTKLRCLNFYIKQRHFSAFRASRRTGCNLQANCSAFIETLAKYNKLNMIDELKVESGLVDHLGTVATRTHQQGSGELHSKPDIAAAVNAGHCSNSVHLKVCKLSSSSTSRFFSETPSDY